MRQNVVIAAAVLAAVGMGSNAWAVSVQEAFARRTDGLASAQASPTKGRAATADLEKLLINKDINGERWAVTWDNEGERITGNVLTPDGVTFIDCTVYRVTGTGDPAVDDLVARCTSADGPNTTPIGWKFLAGALHIPLLFFYP